jgi:hypothetical protein
MDERARESLTARSNRSITGDDEKQPWPNTGPTARRRATGGVVQHGLVDDL